MATYHGLIKLNCLVCGWETTDADLITLVNDLLGDCQECYERFFRWENQDGSIVVSYIDDERNYTNIVYDPKKEKTHQ